MVVMVNVGMRARSVVAPKVSVIRMGMDAMMALFVIVTMDQPRVAMGVYHRMMIMLRLMDSS